MARALYRTRFIAVVVAVIAALGAQPRARARQTPTPAPARVASAEAVLAALVARDFAAVVARFDATMKAALSEQALADGWAKMTAQTGAYVGHAAAAQQPRGGYAAVVIPCEFERGRIDVTVVFNAAGEVSGLSMRPPAPAVSYSPPDYATPGAYAEREVTVGAGREWALPGTLTLPAGRGPFPAIVLVHGSGPNDRDESIGANKPFKDLALGLASRGIAVLRYEKRTKVYGAKLAALRQFTVKEESIDDALAAVSLLRADPAIDSARIYVLGHSLGGMIAPRIAAADPTIAGIVVMAGAARPLERAMLEQMQYLAEADGTITPAEQQAIDGAKQTIAEVAALTPDDVPSGRNIVGAPPAYWLDLRGYDPPAAAATLRQRILVLQGGRDYQVTVAEFDKWKAALDGHANAECKLYPSLNHLFLAGTGKSLPAEYSVPGHVLVDVIDDIATFVKSRG
jgi:dienelactone hydrolase